MDGKGVLGLWINELQAHGSKEVNDTLNISRENFSVPQ